MTELARKTRVRAGHRASTTKIIGRCQGLLAAESRDRTKLLQLRMSLQEKLDVLKQLDEEILGLVEEEKIANEIEQSDDFREGIHLVVIELDGTLSPASVTAPVSPSSTNHFALTDMRPSSRLSSKEQSETA